ncbi:MAG: HAD-IA family hydrolase [Spirochaetales bacterium]|nr:HAD-IA family hydrolase [Spirochaetales bacterium]
MDHDDTAVDSTPTIHYPAFLKVLETFRPGLTISLDTWLEKNFSPGFMEYVTGELAFTPREMEEELEIWREFTRSRTPSFFEGFLDILEQFQKEGGIITVVSHSEVPMIERDYEAAGAGHLPQRIFGWDRDKNKRKPHPWPVEQILKEFNLEPEEVLIVDDLYPAIEMGRAAGVAVAGAGWSHSVPLIRKTMEAEGDWYFTSLAQWRDWLFSPSNDRNNKVLKKKVNHENS